MVLSIMNRNVTDSIPDSKCYGCGICAGICSKQALGMKISRHGFYRPVEIQDTCTKCHICLDICPANTKDNSEDGKNDEVFGKYVSVYGGWAKDPELRKSSSAGGTIRALASELLSSGKVDGFLTISPNKDMLLEPQVKLIEKAENLNEIAKSLYIPTEYSQAVEYLSKREGRYLVVGLPCQIAGLKNARKYLAAEMVLVDLFCGRMVSRLLTEAYLRLFTKEKIENLSLDYRDKTSGWYDFSLTIMDKLNGELIARETFRESIFGFLMYGNYFAQNSCFDCRYGYSGVGDMTVGDFWKHEYKDENQGVSLIVTRSDLGEELLKGSQNISLFQADISDLYSAQSHFVRKYKYSRSKLLSVLKRKHQLFNKIMIEVYQFSKSLKLVYFLSRLDYGLYVAAASSFRKIGRLLNRK